MLARQEWSRKSESIHLSAAAAFINVRETTPNGEKDPDTDSGWEYSVENQRYAVE